MKTPRDLLLAQHQDAERSLDAIRDKVCRGLERESGNGSAPSNHEGLLSNAWLELFVACRRWWMGLGAAWCVIGLVALAGGGSRGGAVSSVGAPPGSLVRAVRQQQELRAELLGLASVTEARVARREENPGPRSEINWLQANV